MATLPPSRFFPPAELADADGLLYVGGSLNEAWLLDAYRHGIFPWPLAPEYPDMLWWSPDPRAIIELDALHVPRRLQRKLASARFTITCDRDFSGVLAGCATAQDRDGATWLTDEMMAAYQRMHERGHAHSVEAWHNGQLAGGVYGIAIGGLFAGESMFYRVTDASKAALVYLVCHLRQRGYRLFDIQQATLHTRRLGAIEIPRREYLRRLPAALEADVTFGALDWSLQ